MTQISEGSQEHVKKNIGTVNELRRKRANKIVLTIIQKGEVLGFEEILEKQSRRQNSIRVTSESCEYLKLSVRNFKEKFYNQSIVMKQLLSNRLAQRNKFHGQLEIQKTEFQHKNHIGAEPVTWNKSQSSKQEPFIAKITVDKKSTPQKIKDLMTQATPQRQK